MSLKQEVNKEWLLKELESSAAMADLVMDEILERFPEEFSTALSKVQILALDNLSYHYVKLKYQLVWERHTARLEKIKLFKKQFRRLTMAERIDYLKYSGELAECFVGLIMKKKRSLIHPALVEIERIIREDKPPEIECYRHLARVLTNEYLWTCLERNWISVSKVLRRNSLDAVDIQFCSFMTN